MMVRQPRPIAVIGNIAIIPLTKGQQAIRQQELSKFHAAFFCAG
jgi:hypothetical protein